MNVKCICRRNVTFEFKCPVSDGQENLQTLGGEIERLIKQQRNPEDGVKRK